MRATAVYTSTGLSYYRHADWLGSSRLTSTPSRLIYSDVAYSPFGQSYAQSGSVDLAFTGQNQDTVPGLYDFAERELSPVQGRWVSIVSVDRCARRGGLVDSSTEGIVLEAN